MWLMWYSFKQKVWVVKNTARIESRRIFTRFNEALLYWL